MNGKPFFDTNILIYIDALVIAAALEASCTVIYSEDMQGGQKIRGLTIRNPFRN